ncbi:sperm flagellar protein 2-like [Corticium candelabrum]|uniref:sperm flagellar protein 2-like n=1 Tax=Corticium candelabrum TaxID=121492 RepID=UPI002E2645DB|nr:sperm flagellar protein 2-like [Corticium candelabrum]
MIGGNIPPAAVTDAWCKLSFTSFPASSARPGRFEALTTKEAVASQAAVGDGKKTERYKIQLEHLTAVHLEEQRLKFRIELIRHKATTVIRELKRKSEALDQLMIEWSGKRFQDEVESIEQLLEVVRQAIENEETIMETLTISGGDFTIEEDVVMIEKPPTPRPVTPPEETMPDSFTVVQLVNLKKQLAEIAPSGVVSFQVLIQKLEEFQSISYGEELLPSHWAKASHEMLEEIVMSLVPSGSEYLDWYHFLVLVALPWPSATQTSLLNTLRRFKAVDTAKTGYVTWEQYCDVQLWYNSEPHNYDALHDSNIAVTYDREYKLRMAIFTLFKENLKEKKNLEVLDYVTMLLHFCVDTNPVLGFMKALSVATGYQLPLSIAHEPVEMLADGNIDSDYEIPLDAFVRVLHLGKASLGYVHRYRETTDPTDKLSKDLLVKAYARYQAGPNKPLPISVFMKDDIILDCIRASKRFKLVDFRSIVLLAAEQGLAMEG